jgi:hypothetical protein
MKRLLLTLLLLIPLTLSSQTVTYTPTSDIIANPERGLQKYSKNISSSGTYNFVNQTTLTNNRTGVDKITVLYRYVMLSEFNNNNSTITSTYLTNLQTDFNRIRNAGVKVIIRPAYTDEYVTAVQPNKQTILNHIDQLTPIINLNKDIIISVQGGFIGVYGEWYYTGGSTSSNTDGSVEFGDEGNISATQWQNRKQIVDAMLNNFDPQIPIQVRYANAKRQMYGSTQITDLTAYQNTPLARVGFYNDAFLNEDGDMGTYSISNCTNPVGTSDYAFIANAGQYLPMNGESNGYNPCDGGFRTTGANAVNELNLLNFSTLNRDYHPDVWGGWIATNHYNEVVRNLGYRLQLNSTTINIGATIDFTMNVTNVGYGNIVSKKNIYLVFRNSSGTVYKKLLSADPRFWRTTHTFSQSLPKDIPDGQYTVLLHIADSNLENRFEYSIRLSNSDITFETTTGFNNLNQIVNIISVGCNTTTWNGSSWSNGTPNTVTTAIINAPYTVNGISPTVNFDCCNLVVNSTLQINNNRFVTFQGDVSGTGNIIVKSGGKLVPVNESSTCNLTNITVERITSTLKKFDYVYFSSPTKNTQISQTLANWNSDRTYTFDGIDFIDVQTNYQGTFISNIPDGQDDFDPSPWNLVTFSSNFITGLGYPSMIVNGSFPRTETVSFNGCINTGVITTPLKISGNPTALLYNPNIIGNPYSSSILADSFIIDNLPNISGTLYFWTHTNTLSNVYSGLEQFNFNIGDYSSYNLSGGVSSSFGGLTPNGFIPSCQGFLVYADIANTNAVFKPSYMAAGYPNSGNFYRLNGDSIYTRVRLNLLDNTVVNRLFKQILINYNSDTSLQYDKGWDAKLPLYNQPLKFYTVGDYEIEARGDFDYSDVVSLGFSTYISSEFKIQVDSKENIQNIYLLDTYLNVFHDLQIPYIFISEAGTFDDRFKIYYTTSLGNVDLQDIELKIVPNPTKGITSIYGIKTNPTILEVFDIFGRNVDVVSTYVNGIINIDLSQVASGMYIVKLNNQKLKIIKE